MLCSAAIFNQRCCVRGTSAIYREERDMLIAPGKTTAGAINLVQEVAIYSIGEKRLHRRLVVSDRGSARAVRPSAIRGLIADADTVSSSLKS